MALEVNGKTIETDEEGYLINRAEWNMDVAAAIAQAEKIEMTETHWGLVEAARKTYKTHQQHLSGNELVHMLGNHLNETPHETRKDVNAFLYQLFPKSPEKQLAKIAGLQKPLPADTE
jgi:TusE/DsrC/DsvC family sulfur relay protein